MNARGIFTGLGRFLPFLSVAARSKLTLAMQERNMISPSPSLVLSKELNKRLPVFWKSCSEGTRWCCARLEGKKAQGGVLDN